MKHKITFSKFKGLNSVVDIESVAHIIEDFARQNKGLKVCNFRDEGNAFIGDIKDLDDFDYGTIAIEPVEKYNVYSK